MSLATSRPVGGHLTAGILDSNLGHLQQQRKLTVRRTTLFDNPQPLSFAWSEMDPEIEAAMRGLADSPFKGTGSGDGEGTEDSENAVMYVVACCGGGGEGSVSVCACADVL